MPGNRINKAISFLLCAAYLNLLAVTVFHFHFIHSDCKPYYVSSESNHRGIVDPFGDDESNCSVTQFAASSYINERSFENSIRTAPNLNKIPIYTNSNPLFFLVDSNSLRAPPSLS